VAVCQKRQFGTLDAVFLKNLQAGSPHIRMMPTPAMMKAAELFQERGETDTTSLMLIHFETWSDMHRSLPSFQDLSICLSRLLCRCYNKKMAKDYRLPPEAHGILIVHDFLVIFNFTRKMMGEDYLSAKDVTTALAYYDRVSPDVAKRLMR
jgi:hypothetical protein